MTERESQLKHIRLTLAVAEVLANNNVTEAYELIAARLNEQKNPLLLAAYLHYQQNEQAKEMNSLVGKAIRPRTVYQCNECGFRHQKIVWHCPACHAWSSFRPLIELKLEQR